MIDFKIIAVDFDGTLCENKWPEIGAPNEELINHLKSQQVVGNKVILWTCREGDLLSDAINWCRGHGLLFDAINENLPDVIREFGGSNRKIFAHEYIDDRNSLYLMDSQIKELTDSLRDDIRAIIYGSPKKEEKGE